MRTTVTLDDDHVAHLDSIREHDDEPDAAVVRRCVERSQELTAAEQRVTAVEQELTALEEEIAAMEADHETELKQKDARIRELNNKLAEAHSRIDTTNELVERVEGELTARERREQRERKKAEAGLLTRAKWSVFGMDLSEEEG
jgi:chromosome segregation ATPase